MLKARNQAPLFCMPRNLALDEGIILSLLDHSRVPSSPPFSRGLGSPLVVLDPVLGKPI